MAWLGWLGIAAALAGATWEVDATSLHLHRGTAPVATFAPCDADAPEDEAPRTLGVALVAYSKKQGTMSWGHASLRVVSCSGPELVDLEYETYRLSGWNEEQLRSEHRGEVFTRGDWLSSQRGALVLFRNRDPVDAGWYGDAQARNREIYEVWLDLSQEDLDAVAQRADAAYAEQLSRLRAGQDLPQRYDVVRRNCTWVLSSFLPQELVRGAPITPFAWVRRLPPDVVRARVLHPSHHLVNRWDGSLLGVTERVRPVFRRPRRIRRDRLDAVHASLSGARPWLPAVAGGGGGSDEREVGVP
ncbi:MAG: hypothetical protein KTR31_05350 [Myxococcales bacterium]|nr:hypothetical protein [Myxococcales bacterium]